jgi:signal peptidase
MKNRVIAKHIFIIMVMLSFFLMVCCAVLPRGQGSGNWISGYRLLIVRTNSMEPAIRAGSVILIGQSAPDQLRVGDIVTFRTLSGPESDYPKNRTLTTTHRIVGIRKRGNRIFFITKGDANRDADPNTPCGSDIIGKVRLAIPCAGSAIMVFRTQIGFLLCVLIPGISLMTAEIKSMASALRQSGNTNSERLFRK